MKFKNCVFVLFIFGCLFKIKAQQLPVSYQLGEQYHDRYKYSNLLAISEDGHGGTILVRSYYTGMVLKPKGYFIEHYNKDLELIAEYNYKLKGPDFVNAFVKNGQLHMLLLEYNTKKESYDYVVHRSSITNYDFTQQTILCIPSKEVVTPLDHNYYDRKFSSLFTSSVFFNEAKTAFVISSQFRTEEGDKHFMYLFDTALNKLMEHDFSQEIEEKIYGFEHMVISPDQKQVYLIGKAFFRKKRFQTTDRRFQYELVQMSKNGLKTQHFDDVGKFSESLKPLLLGDKLLCVGFYADRKDNRYNGLAYFDIDPLKLTVNSKKYHPFSQQFMEDKYGRSEKLEVKNLIFKNLSVNSENDILYNAEEYFVTSGMQDGGAGTRIKIDRYHYNDIVSAKLTANGEMVWARNINKAEVTQGDGAYASYSSYAEGDNTYFVISTAAENPQLLTGERLIFKQGLGRNRNVFAICLDKKGQISYDKIIDDKEARLPLMVSMPLINKSEGKLLFYAKRGSRKQLVKVIIEPVVPSAVGSRK
ncbi:hypothetical protein HCG49_09155 [Arenibacter sp. 6A1]|uniref:hypothetical protein n=1 Tax=Arenibacter sp. 6A1 TaxID=2720391 RepID=UPI00144730E2|nr:hypothetical protein [Arenibacter sp. 6A1]NKI26727.1 hypothetical protein [Arenibacter sp. 6A1]